MIYYIIQDWIKFMDREFCKKNPGSQQCETYHKFVEIDRAMRYFLFDPTWVMVQEFFEKGTTKHFFEKLMIFDDWSDHLPLITKNKVRNPREAQIEFFSTPKERRGLRLNYTD